MPRYEHILVDEYQDVNDNQMRLLKTLNPRNLFCVGDPRQAIYGWRGSRMEYLMEFSKHFDDASIIYLANNYRSVPAVIDLANRAIRDMALPDLEAHREDEGEITLRECRSQEDEAAFVVEEICKGNMGRMFVLARTNKQLDPVSARLSQLGIAHEIRTEAKNDEDACATHQLILSTVHAIKGMEADTVFLIGCSSLYFPFKVSDHPVFDSLSVFSYDRELEELRLFYVGMTRAKQRLYMTYTGSYHTPFISPEMKSLVKRKDQRRS